MIWKAENEIYRLTISGLGFAILKHDFELGFCTIIVLRSKITNMRSAKKVCDSAERGLSNNDVRIWFWCWHFGFELGLRIWKRDVR